MKRTKLGLLGLCPVALGLVAFSATAQATTGAKWLILNINGELREAATLPAIANLEKDSSIYVLHTEILKIKVLFLCTNIKAVNAKLLGEGSVGKEPGVVSGSKVLFSGCTTDLAGSPAPECTPKDPEDGEGTIVTKPLHALLVLGTSGENLLEAIPDTGLGGTIAVISLPAPCPIGTSVPILGKYFSKDCENLASTHLVKHLIEQGPGTELWAISKTEEHKATFLGSAWGLLEGLHKGLGFSGDPA